MGGNNNMRNLLIAAGALFAGAAAAQISVADVRTVFETLEFQLKAQNDNIKVIDFENVRGREFAGGVILNNQYAKSHGVFFGPGVTVHRCASQLRTTSEVDANQGVRLDDRPCIYPSAASGEHVAFFRAGRAGSSLSLAFPAPVQALALKINPTGGERNEEFIAAILGYRDAKSEKPDVQSTMRFSWSDDAIGWPHVAALETKGDRVERVEISLRRASGSAGAVRFLFDDLALVSAPEETTSPLGVQILSERTTMLAGDPAVIRQPDADAAAGLRIFAPPREVRLPIDWDAVDAVLAEQVERSIKPAALDSADEPALDRATLPVVLPMAADGPIDLAVQESGDSYSAVFERDGNTYEIYGTRVFTVVDSRTADGAGALRYQKMHYGRAATFSMFGGASYRVIQYCDTGSANGDALCAAQNRLGGRIEELAAAVGAAAEVRP